MNIRVTKLFCITVVALLSIHYNARGQLPPDFPQLSILPNTNPAPGYLFGNLNADNVPGVSNYFAILDNDGSPILLNKTNSLGKLACNGLFVSQVGTRGPTMRFVSKDSSFTPITTNWAGNGYGADRRDIVVLPNGHALIMIVDEQYVDLSTIVPGGDPNTRISGNVIQEVDVDNNVVFQWRILDHIPITDTYSELTRPGSYAHVNSVWYDETDGTIILSCRNTSEVIKISRTTGEVIWRLGGKQNQFTFTNGIPGNADPAWFQVQHSACRHANGNLTVFDNGYSDHSDPQYDFSRPYSRGVEYELDEVSMIAKLVWQFRHDPDIITYNGGASERLPDGHSILTWGNDNNASPRLAMTEVDEAGNLVCDVALLQDGVSGSFTRVIWPLESTYVNVTNRELAELNTYVFTEGTNATGVSMTVDTLDGDQYNSVTVSRQPFAPVLPRFLAKAPRVVQARLHMTQSLINDLTGQLDFDVNSFGLSDPTNTTVYYRQTPGQGLFVPVSTEYNWVTHQLQTAFSGFGEYIFGFPDVPEVPYPPLLLTPKPEGEVNQDLPVTFFWTPKGFVASFRLQVSTNADFATLVLDQPYLTECRYTNVTVLPGTRYYWRVNTSNDGGVSDWATNTFTTVPPMVQVVAPNGGEVYQRGLRHVIRWQANIAEQIALDLYQDGDPIAILATNATDRLSYNWRISVSLDPGSDYSIRIRSTTNAALFDMSDAPFSIVDAPTIDAASITRLEDGRVQFGLTVAGMAQATVIGSTNLVDWEELETVPVTEGSAVFTDTTATNLPCRFYRIRLP